MIEVHSSDELIINYIVYVYNTSISVLSIPCMKMFLYCTHLIPISFYSVLLNFLCMFVNLIYHCMIEYCCHIDVYNNNNDIVLMMNNDNIAVITMK